eukprot:jgi/Mesen1/8044/ME000043S07426
MVSASELEKIVNLEKQLEASAGKNGGSFSTRLQYLQLVRKHKLRRSELVARYGVDLLNSSIWRSKLGNEVWNVYEQVAVAALDCHSTDVAKECVGALLKKFPDSIRVGKLEGMWFEATGNFTQADKIYSSFLEEFPGDAALRKRQVAMLKAQGDLPAAVDALNKYLETFMADADAWRELADMYISLQMYKQAAFCCEELLLVAPLNPLFNLLYAEVLFTMGGLDNLRAAKKYYAAAIQHSGCRNMRALHGVCLTTAAIKELVRSSRSKGGEEEATGLTELATKLVLEEYSRKNTGKLKLVKDVMAKQGLNVA